MVDHKPRPKDVETVGRGMQPSHVRQANQRTILSVISLQPGISNAELARFTQLAPQTISAVLADLAAAKLITRGEVLRGKRGQPATPISMNPEGAFAIGVEIGWERLQVSLVGIGMAEYYRYRRDHDYPDATTIFRDIAAAVRDAAGKLTAEQRPRLAGMALALPRGIGEPLAFRPAPTEQVAPWAGLDVAGMARQATGLDVLLVNDGDAACWAERVHHPVPRPASFAFLLLDTLVAAGIYVNNRLWEGSGQGSDMGSMLVTDRHGASRFVHEIASLHALRLRLRDSGFDLAAVLDAPGDPAVEQVVDGWADEAAQALAQAVVSASSVFELDMVVIEAALPRRILERIVDGVRLHVSRFPRLGGASPPIAAGHAGRSSTAQGAALLLMHRRFFSRDLAHLDPQGATSQ